MVVEAGQITPTELARRADMDPAVVTRQTRLLEAGGHLTRTRNGGDGRLSTVAATELGCSTVERMRTVLNQHLQLALGQWADQDVEALAGLMARLDNDLRAIPYPDLVARNVGPA
jgi:DNA-binding MarR family transcriptional regulator